MLVNNGKGWGVGGVRVACRLSQLTGKAVRFFYGANYDTIGNPDTISFFLFCLICFVFFPALLFFA